MTKTKKRNTATKKRNANDATARNVRASRTRDTKLLVRVQALEARCAALEEWRTSTEKIPADIAAGVLDV